MATYYRWRQSNISRSLKSTPANPSTFSLGQYGNQGRVTIYYAQNLTVDNSGKFSPSGSQRRKELTAGERFDIPGDYYFIDASWDQETTCYQAMSTGATVQFFDNSAGNVQVTGVANIITPQLGPGALVGYVYSINASAYPNGGESGGYYYDQRTTVTSPSNPPSITVPESIKGGDTITISWGAATGTAAAVSGYTLERSVNGGTSWAQVYQGNALTTTNLVEKGTPTVTYRVRAYDANSQYSGYTTSPARTVTNNEPPTAPGSISVSPPVAGQTTTITITAATDPDGTIASYKYERSVDAGDWEQIAETAELTQTDTIGAEWGTVAYRACAVDNEGAVGPYATSETYTVTAGRIIISGPSSNLGTQPAPFEFSVGVSITGTASATGILVTIRVDGTRVYNELVNAGQQIKQTIDTRLIGEGTHAINVTASKAEYETTARAFAFSVPGFTLPDGGRMEQLENSAGAPVFPVTLARAVIGDGGKSVAELLEQLRHPANLPSLLPNFAAEQIDENTVDLSADKVPAEDNPYLDSATWTYLSGDVYPAGPDDGTAIQLTREEITYSTASAASARAAVTTLGQKAAGDIVKLNENGNPVEFYVAKQDYENELNGSGRTLLVRKDVYSNQVWDAGNVNAYAESDIDSWFNTTYKALLDESVQEAIGTTKFYYTPGNGNDTVGTLERGIFALSATELGRSYAGVKVEGSALPIASTLQVAYRNESATTQWTRSPYTSSTNDAIFLTSNGHIGSSTRCASAYGSRPCFTLPATLGVDADGNIVADDGRIHKQISWTQGTPLTARQFTYNENGDVQDTLDGAIAQVGGAPADLSEVFGENSWSTIKWACENNNPVVDSWLVGDSKNETIGGEVLTFVIIGKDHDDRADGSGKAKLSIGMKECMAQTRQMNATNTNAGSFVGSGMYSWLSGTLYPSLPDGLKNSITKVNKKTSEGGGSSVIRTDVMYLWLFSEIEVFGTTTYSYAGEGTQYPYFATAAERIKRLSNGSGAASYWWERSPQSPTYQNTNFCLVTPSGEAVSTGAGSSDGVCFGFCI